MLDALWTNARDNWGVTVPEGRGDYAGIFEKRVYIPTDVVATTATAPNGAVYTGGSTFTSYNKAELEQKKAIPNHNDDYFGKTKFIDLRPMYKNVTDTPASGTTTPKQVSWTALEAAYAKYAAGDKDAFNDPAVKHSYHRFWGQGDYLMALGAMAELYPALAPTPGEIPGENGDQKLTFSPSAVTVEAGATANTTASAAAETAVSSAPGVATVTVSGTTVTVTGVSAGTATITVTGADGKTGTFTVTVTAGAETTTPAITTPSGETTTPAITTPGGGTSAPITTPGDFTNYIWGDVDEKDGVEIGDLVLLNKFLVGRFPNLKAQYPKGWIQSHTRLLNDADPVMADSLRLVKALTGAIEFSELKPSNVQ